METVTPIDIAQMTDEERAELNKKTGRKILKLVAIKVGITVGIVAAAHLVAKKLDEANEETDSEED